MDVKEGRKERERTRSAFFACSTASQGAGRSRNTVADIRGVEGEQDGSLPASTSSTTVNPSLHTFR